MVSGMKAKRLSLNFSMSFYASHYCLHFLFLNQCGLSLTDVNDHLNRVCVCVCEAPSRSYEAKAGAKGFCLLCSMT